MKTSDRVTFDTVRAYARSLGVVESVTYGRSPAWRVDGQVFACMAIHSSAEPDSLVVWVPLDQRDELLAAEPETYYVTPHYADHPVVVVRLSRIRRDALQDLLLMAHGFVKTTAAKKRPIRRDRPARAGRSRRPGGARRRVPG